MLGSVGSVRFADLAAASGRIAATRSRLEKTQVLVTLLDALDPAEIAQAVGWLVQEPASGPLGVGPAQLWRLSRSEPPEASTVTLAEVERVLGVAARVGRGTALARVAEIFEKLTAPERVFFIGALTGSLRQGSLGGIMQRALAELAGVDESTVRRAVLVRGSVAHAARDLLSPERVAPSMDLEIMRPLTPMLASHADSVEDAFAVLGLGSTDECAAVEWKIDGVRAQVHKTREHIAIFTRQGHDMTASCAPLIAALSTLRASSIVLDAEVVLVGPDGKARPFQDSFSALASGDVARTGDELRIFLFDCLHRDGTDLLDMPLTGRLAALHAVAPPELCIPQLQTRDPTAARHFYGEALAAGHEGVMIKALTSPYQLGARGRAWQKVKACVTVDLIVLAAEWGSGRRKGWLSNLHLGARRGDGSFCMVGKTFKGLTDALLHFQTERLLELATERAEHVVHVRPELVVEIRFNDVQRSSRYPGGIALRFARVVRYRQDKRASEVEELDALIARLPESLSSARMNGKTGAARQQLSLFKD
jgi:DNA ligase-1